MAVFYDCIQVYYYTLTCWSLNSDGINNDNIQLKQGDIGSQFYVWSPVPLLPASVPVGGRSQAAS